MSVIENDYLSIKTREQGAELISIFDKKSSTERLWDGNEQFWGWHSPVLFPVVGRCMNDQIEANSHFYPMSKHGFARQSNFTLVDESQTSAIYSLQSSEELLRSYPYQFEFRISYQLKGSSIIILYLMFNRDTQALYFSLGAHPAFAVNGNYNDSYIEFEKKETLKRHYINSDGFFDGTTEEVLNDSNLLPLTKTMFAQDALIFKNPESKKVSLRNKTNKRYVTVHFEGFDYLGFWAKPGAPFVCIEPWLGCADTAGKIVELREKEGIIPLEVGEEFKRTIEIEIG